MATDQDIAFPTLSASHLGAISARAHPRAVRAGETLFAEGDRNFCFFVVMEGSVDIVEHSTEIERLVRTHGRGEFTGDVDMLSGRSALVTARAAQDGRVLEMSTAELRALVDGIPELGQMIVKAFLMRRTILLSEGFEGAKILGSRFQPETHKLRDFATRNAIPFRFIDLESDADADAILRQFNISAAETPIIIGRNGQWRVKPTLQEFANCAGLTVPLEADHVYDLVVVGAGPAGLAASVYAASEGLDVLTLEQEAPGGQAGTSALIENYLGFPSGISGRELIGNALLQAQRFNAHVTISAKAQALGLSGGDRVVTLTDGTRILARCILVATGVKYRDLLVPNFDRLVGAGVYFSATDMDVRPCKGVEVVVVGGGNSAGQAIVSLSRYASRVHVLVRGSDLGKSMSRYLVDRINGIENVTVHLNSNVTALEGNGRLNSVRYSDANGDETSIGTDSLFNFCGADANTAWLRGCVDLDSKGFVNTGPALSPSITQSDRWNAIGRAPFLLETSLPGVFAAGDVRSGSVKRCASAVGEGSMAVTFVHAHIARPA